MYAVGCLSDQTTVDFLEHRLTEARQADVKAHLDQCAECRAVIAETARAVVDAPSARRAPGCRVGRYVLETVIGAGAMGIVYSAHDPELDRRVAVKLLHPGLADKDRGARQRMKREARAMAKLAHPNVVAVHDVGDAGDDVFVAMEFVQGQTLAAWLAEAPRDQRQILDRFVQAACGVAAAHEAGLVHRDFKPENVLLGADGRARVTDFGLARRTAGAPMTRESLSRLRVNGSEALTLTRTGTFAGTPRYMAPEQIRGQPATPHSDQFSFCVALYEALYRERPFVATSFEQLAEKVLSGEVGPAPVTNTVSLALRAVLLRGLRVAQAERHPTMKHLLDALLASADQGAVRRRWRPWPLLAIGGAAMAAAALLVLPRRDLPAAAASPEVAFASTLGESPSDNRLEAEAVAVVADGGAPTATALQTTNARPTHRSSGKAAQGARGVSSSPSISAAAASDPRDRHAAPGSPVDLYDKRR